MRAPSSGTGECMKDCKSLSDVVTCGSSASCEYGFPFGPIVGGRGLCVPAQGRWAAGGRRMNADDCSGGLTRFQAPGGELCGNLRRFVAQRVELLQLGRDLYPR